MLEMYISQKVIKDRKSKTRKHVKKQETIKKNLKKFEKNGEKMVTVYCLKMRLLDEKKLHI